MNKIIVIVGPTGVGKTKLSIALAKKFNGEIINADSMQVYKGLDIGTAKVMPIEREDIPHHLFDICDVNDNYTVYQYQKDARRKIEEVRSRGHIPILVGGTGLYIKAALYKYEFQEENEKSNYDELSNEELYKKIKGIIPDTKVHPNNRVRLVRLMQQIDANSLSTKKGNEALYDFICIGLTANRDTLYHNIDIRVDKMVKDGLVQEVESFYEKGIKSKAIMTGIGYKELYRYFDQDISLDEAISLIQKNSRHYAKRQFTFFRNQLPVLWVETNYDDFNQTIEEVEKIINEKTQE